jgi:formamidopyrimidine-DNA glycosylase
MPELPEVETIIQRLRVGTQNHPALPGHVIREVNILWEGTIAQPSPQAFSQHLLNQRILDARRRGKHLHFPLEEGHLIAHLRMSGDMRMMPEKDAHGKAIPRLPHDRVILTFTDGWQLAFNNPRKFGRMWWVDDPAQVFADLGPEPLSDAFTPGWFYENLQSHHRLIKPLLLDQHFLAGLGNIYTDESLHRARIHPRRKSDSLSKRESQALHGAIQHVLKEGIKRFGASLDWVYRGGEFQNYFQVYQQTGEPCPYCGTPIEKISVGQRGTHFCPACQQLQ